MTPEEITAAQQAQLAQAVGPVYTQSTSAQGTFHSMLEVLGQGDVDKSQARATLVLLGYRPNAAVRTLLAGATEDGIAHMKEIVGDKSPTPAGLIEKAKAGAAKDINAKNKDEAQHVLSALRDAPGIFAAVASDPGVRRWAQHTRQLADEVGFDDKLGLGPPPPTRQQAADMSDKEASRLYFYWTQHPDEAQTFYAIRGVPAAVVYKIIQKKAGVAGPDPVLEPIFFPGAPETDYTTFALGAAGAVVLGFLGYVVVKSRNDGPLMGVLSEDKLLAKLVEGRDPFIAVSRAGNMLYPVHDLRGAARELQHAERFRAAQGMVPRHPEAVGEWTESDGVKLNAVKRRY